MNLLAWILSLSILISLMIQAVSFHKATVCRQKAWLKSTELITRTTLSNPKALERDWDLSCRLHLLRSNGEVHWQKLPSLKKHVFALHLEGTL